MSKHLSNDKRQVIMRMLEAGESVLGIAHKTDSSEHTVRRIRKEMGIPPRSHSDWQMTWNKYYDIINRIISGESLAGIARTAGIDIKTVNKIRDKITPPEKLAGIQGRKNASRESSVPSNQKNAGRNQRPRKLADNQ